MKASREHFAAGVSVVVLAAGLLGTAVFADPLKKVKSLLLDGSALVSDSKNGRLISINGSSARGDLAIRLPSTGGRGISVVQRDGRAYVVVNGGTAKERVLYRVDDPSARLPTAPVAAKEQVLTGGGTLYTVRAETDEVVAVRRDPLSLRAIAAPLQYPAGSRMVIDRRGNLAVFIRSSGSLSFVDESGGSAPTKIAGPGEDIELGVVGDGVVVLRPKLGVAILANADGDIRAVKLGFRGERAKLADVADGDVTSALLDTAEGPRLVRINSVTGAVEADPVTVDFDSVEAPLVARDGVYLARPSAAQVLRIGIDGRVTPIQVEVGRGARAFRAFVDDGFVYVNNPGGPRAAVVDDSGVRFVEKYSQSIREVAPNGKPKPKSKSEGNNAPAASPSASANRPSVQVPPTVTTTRLAPVSITPPSGGIPTSPLASSPVVASPVTPTAPPPVPAGPSTTLAQSQPSSTTSTAPPGPVAAAPGPVSNLSAAGRNRSLVLTWEAPTDDGGSPIKSYSISCTPSCGSLASQTPALTISGLVNDRPYEVTVFAVNAVGDGAPASVTATPSQRVAPPPSGVTASVATSGSGDVSIAWTPAALSGFTVSGYSVVCRSSAGGQDVALTVAGDAANAVIGGAAGWGYDSDATPDYTCSVATAGEYSDEPGNSLSSAPVDGSSIDPWIVATAVTDVAGSAGDGTVSWSLTSPDIRGRSAQIECSINDSTTQSVVDVQLLPAQSGSTCSRSGLANGHVYAPSVVAVVPGDPGSGDIRIAVAVNGSANAYPSGRPVITANISTSKSEISSSFSLDLNGLRSATCEIEVERIGLGGYGVTIGDCTQYFRGNLPAGKDYKVWLAITGLDGAGNSHRYDSYVWNTSTQQALATIDVVAHYSGIGGPSVCGTQDGTTLQSDPTYVKGGNGTCAPQGSQWSIACWTEGTGHNPVGSDRTSSNSWGMVDRQGWLNYNYLSGDPGVAHC